MVGCWTAQRVSDYNNISKDSIHTYTKRTIVDVQDPENPGKTKPEIRRTGATLMYLSGACAWMYKYEVRKKYSPDSVIDAQTTFAQFLEKITPEDKAALEFCKWDEEIEWE